MRPIRERDHGEVRRRSGTGSYDVSGLRAERAEETAGPKRPRWVAATAAALLVGGAAAAVAMSMSGGDDSGKDNKAHSQAPAGSSTSSNASTPPGTTTRSTAVGLRFVSARELPQVPVSIEGAPRMAAFKDASGTSTLFVFVTGSDGSVWYLPGENSRAWLPLRGLKTNTEPAVVATSAGHLELFAVRESDGVVHQRSYADGAWSAKWVPVGTAKLHGAPSALANTDGSVVLAAVGSGKSLMTSTGSPGGSGAYSWGDWQAVPGADDVAGVALTAAPATSGFNAYVSRASDEGVLAIPYANKQWGTPAQTPLSGLPTAATSGDGTAYVFVRSAGGAVKAMNGNGQAGAGGLQSALPPGATQTPDGRVVVVTAASPTRLRVSYSG
jgi:hypothetical protein